MAQTASSIVVAATPAEVMDVIADLEAYPQWAASVRSVEVLDVHEGGRPARARFVFDTGPIKGAFTLAYEWSGDEQVRWHLVEGDVIKALEGSYALLCSGPAATEVAYRLTVDVGTPMLGLVKRKAEKMIIDTALMELRERVESRVGRAGEDGANE